jgi:demethylspheroidene O-methyltransferase
MTPVETTYQSKREDKMLVDFLDQVKSFALARVLMTAIELDLFPTLGKCPQSRADLKVRLQISDTLISDAFFDTLIAFDVVVEREGKLALQPLGQSILPVYESIRSWNNEMRLFYNSLTGLTELLRAGDYRDTDLAHYWIYKSLVNRKSVSSTTAEEYSKIMDESQVQLSQLIVEHYDFSQHRHVIDFGGGKGRLAMALAKRYPELKVTVADLPGVCEGARARVESEGMGDRVRFIPVDFFEDELPIAVADAVLFVRVLHDWNDKEVAGLTQRTRHCLQNSGAVIVIEPMWGHQSDMANRGAVLSALMLTLFGGRRRSVEDYIRILSLAGYSDLSWSDLGLSLYKVVVGHKS